MKQGRVEHEQVATLRLVTALSGSPAAQLVHDCAGYVRAVIEWGTRWCGLALF